MLRRKVHPQELVQSAHQGSTEALEALLHWITPDRVTDEILAIPLKHLTTDRVPAPTVFDPEAFIAVLSTSAVRRPALCLRILWKIFSILTSKPSDKFSVVDWLLESIADICSWIRFCLAYGHLCLPKPLPSASKTYLEQAKLLLELYELDERTCAALITSPAFSDLLVHMWVRLGDGNCRSIMNINDQTTCPIITMAIRILEDEKGRQTFLQRVSSKRLIGLFCKGIDDRLRDCTGVPANLYGLLQSIEFLLHVTKHTWHLGDDFRKSLSGTHHLMQFAHILDEASVVYAKHDPRGDSGLKLLSVALFQLCGLVVEEKTRSRNFRAWRDLLGGDFLPLLMRVTSSVTVQDEDRWMNTIRIVEALGGYLPFPHVFNVDPRIQPPTEIVAGRPKAQKTWQTFWKAFEVTQKAFDTREGRPEVEICDNPLCDPSTRPADKSSKECAGCYTVVYCSDKCQKEDWDEWHYRECGYGRVISPHRKARAWYDRATRASQATLVEIIYNETDCPEFASRDVMPIFDCMNMEGLSLRKYYLQDLTDEDGWWVRPETPSDLKFSAHLRPRLGSLIDDYKSGELPDGWRLAEAVVPPFGPERYIFLTVLLKPVGGKYESVYCIPRYGFALELLCLWLD
ncbi:hypothetical protein NMY22_g4903 [Coprinellus aureogranulatus]|nr:hypothetical protein NMY22_g4903 [Coprinellus aureogranulatus]